MTLDLTSAPPTAIAALEAELVELLGPRGVTSELRARERASVDGSLMSPIIVEQLPLGLADLVAFPATAEQIGDVVAAAVRHGVPVTPRGKGTGNYGQGIPLAGGLVLDTSRARAVVEVGDGWITAEAGAPMVALERAAAEQGQQLWMYPSTAQSCLGGFLSGGSGGTGTIAHGSNDMGFVVALDVVHGDGSPELHHVEGAEAQRYVHNYGTAGIIARATVRLEPLQDWRGVFASFPDLPSALRALRILGRLDPLPRLVSADGPEVIAALPPDPAFPAGRASLRMIADVATVGAARVVIEGAGGQVEDVREGPQVVLAISMLSYNHPVEWLQKSAPGTYFHVEVAGEALVDRPADVAAVYEGGLLHVEAGHSVPIGMLAGVYQSPEQVRAGIAALNALGVGVHDPHQWNVDFELQRTVETARRTDPGGLLNPGKLNPEYAGPTKGSIR
ncbi:FAD binding domain-containing protein [Motilibacter rhizosphaerae]|uniref:FAD binding domain-containing protein n=1 Tax=Motilibacter rhizosphaerae TaxID=598652 RepID=A0A4Q7NG23_9ACTN|nr:FAD-binding oxidoreductase [Motilibacter rhizosphaerae]RZS82688.1 FAD binding domain-containing protein [Motilibacter rhizosphaerae]